MDAYKTILIHYYSYVSLKNSTSIFHSCQTSFVPCSMKNQQPCSNEKRNKCESAGDCKLNKICEKCNALELEPFCELMRYFEGKNPDDLSSFRVCFGNRIPYYKNLVELELELKDFDSYDSSSAWITGKVLVMCLFTTRYSQNPSLLGRMVTLFRGDFSEKNNDDEIQSFLNEFDIKQDFIPLNSNLGAMLNQAINEVKVYMKIDIPMVSKIIALKLRQFCLRNQSCLQYN